MSIKSEIEWGTEQKKWFSLGVDYGICSTSLKFFGRLFLHAGAEELILMLEDAAKELWRSMKEAFQKEPELETLLFENYSDLLLAFKEVYHLED